MSHAMLQALDHPTTAVIVSRLVVGALPVLLLALWWTMHRLEQVNWARAQQRHLDAAAGMGTQSW